MKVGQREALRIQELMTALCIEIYGRKTAYVLIVQDEGSLDIATNARPADLKNLPPIVREAADMIEGNADTVQKHFEDAPIADPNVN